MAGSPINIGSGPFPVRQRVVDTITLPVQTGGLYYQFGYNAGTENPSAGWGEVSSIRLPSGASAAYTYKLDPIGNTIPVAEDVIRNSITSKVLTYLPGCDDGCDEARETTSYNIDQQMGQSTITGPDGGVTKQYFVADGPMTGTVYKTEGPDGTVTEQIWAINVPQGVAFLDQAGVNQYVKTSFTSIRDKSDVLIKTAIQNFTYDKNGNVIATEDYDYVNYGSVARNSSGFPTGSLTGLQPVRKTVTEFANRTNYAGSSTETGNEYYSTTAPALLALPAWSEVRDGANTHVSRTEFYYDGAGSYATPPTHGNVTSQLIWDDHKGGTIHGWSDPLTPANANVVQTQYDQYGNPVLITDANNNQTQITYGAVAGAGTDNLYPTQTKTAFNTGIEQTKKAYYDFSTGAVIKSTDSDRGVDTLTSYDVFGRPKLVTAAAGTPLETRSTVTYDDLGRRVITRADLNLAGDGKLVKIEQYDPLGRVWLSRMLEDSATQSVDNQNAGIKVQTRYGMVNDGTNCYSYQLTSNPYRANTASVATAEVTMGWSRSISLADGSRTESETFSGVAVPQPDIPGTYTSTGKVVTFRDGANNYVRDQADKWRMSTTNALGQMVSVTEDPTASFDGYVHTGTNLVTNYGYDMLSNLTHVGQGGQSRDFVYSTLGRLISASNPESGTIAYQYDPNGNLTKKTDARVVVNYTYDDLNRPLSRTYLGVNTPAVTYTYFSGGVSTNNGNLASVANSVSSTTYTGYDALGRVKGSQQTTDGQTYAMSYAYNLAGALTEETYPSGRVVHHHYAADGKLAATSSRIAANRPFKSYAQNFSYNPAGAVTGMQLGNMRWESTQYNSRMQPTQIGLGTTPGATDLLDLDYSYGTTSNNGNVSSQTISVDEVGDVDGFVVVQSYTYDELNRLKSATENSTPTGGSSAQSWKQTYLFDRFGNRTIDTSSGATTTLPSGSNSNIYNPTINPANNQFNTGQDYNYDLTGNVIEDATGKKFNYDGENKQTSFGTGGSLTNGGTYFYDGDGQRIKKVVGTEVTVFVYDATGQMIAEYATTGPTSPQINYLTSDALSTPRIDTDASGAIISRHDYFPFGEEIFTEGNRGNDTAYSADGIRQKFTRKERDCESGLDYFMARYYSSSVGRFTGPDEFTGGPQELFEFADTSSNNPTFYGSLSNPQSLNKYQYSFNNPLRYIDPDGHDPVEPQEPITTSIAIVEVASTVGTSVITVATIAGTGAVAVVGGATTVAGIAGKGINITAKTAGNAIGSAIEGASKLVSGESSPAYDLTPRNLELMGQGKAPIGRDGHPVEIHHDGQKDNGTRREMTRTDHRGKGNHSKNHPERGRSKVDHGHKWKKWKKQHWKGKEKTIRDQQSRVLPMPLKVNQRERLSGPQNGNLYERSGFRYCATSVRMSGRTITN